jgi:hypothetical protein
MYSPRAAERAPVRFRLRPRFSDLRIGRNKCGYRLVYSRSPPENWFAERRSCRKPGGRRPPGCGWSSRCSPWVSSLPYYRSLQATFLYSGNHCAASSGAMSSWSGSPRIMAAGSLPGGNSVRGSVVSSSQNRARRSATRGAALPPSAVT